MRALRLLLLIVTLGFPFSWSLGPPAYSAQNGRVTAETASIYSAPSSDSGVVAEVKKGDLLRISNRAQNGWYKVVLPGGASPVQYGWMNTDDLVGLDLLEDQRVNHVQPGKTRYHADLQVEKKDRTFVLGAYLTAVSPTDIQTLASMPNKSLLLPGIHGELVYLLGENFGLGVHLTYLSLSEAASSANNYKIVSYEAAALLEYYPYWGHVGRLGLGLGLMGAYTAVSVDRPDPTIITNLLQSTQSAIVPSGFVRLAYRVYFSPQVGLQAAGGYRYFQESKISVANGEASLKMTGLFGEVGLFYDF